MHLPKDAKHDRDRIFAKPWLLKEVQKVDYKTYTGVGSRSTPDDIQRDMRDIACAMAENDWVLRTGDADGADKAFAFGADIGGGPREVYTPDQSHKIGHHMPGTREARIIAQSVWEDYVADKDLPEWSDLKPYTQRLMARNTSQVLGYQCNDPSACLICWTPDGVERGPDTNKSTGGTGQAIRLADKYDVPVYNLGNEGSYSRIMDWVNNQG